MNWSEHAWKAIQPIYAEIIHHPFLIALRDGTLPPTVFRFYIAQDAHYLEHFGRALVLIGARLTDSDDALAYMRFGEQAIVVERALHQSYFQVFDITDRGVPEPACHHYIHFLKSTAALDPVEVAMAAVLPCFWIYQEVGRHLLAGLRADDNPYQRWVDTYAGEEFGMAVRSAITLCDRAADGTTEAIRQRMTEAFVTASRLEYRFWDCAYREVRW